MFDAALFVYVKRTEAEQPRANDGQADDVRIWPRHLSGKFRERQLRKIKFAVRGEPGEAFMVPQIEPGVVDAFRLYDTEAKIAEMVVIRGGDAEFKQRHPFSSLF